jgi:dienelactone hydrolase
LKRKELSKPFIIFNPLSVDRKRAAYNMRIANSWAGRWSHQLQVAIGFCSGGRISFEHWKKF